MGWGVSFHITRVCTSLKLCSRSHRSVMNKRIGHINGRLTYFCEMEDISSLAYELHS
jgi:hypothetical protein